jgi:stage III sporulation protein AD
MIKVSMVAVAGVVFSVFLKHKNQEWAMLVTMATCAVLIACVVVRLGALAEYFDRFGEYLSVGSEYGVILLKMAGVSYVAEIASALCRDSGCQSLAAQVEMFGRLSVLAIGMPVLFSLFDTLERLLAI